MFASNSVFVTVGCIIIIPINNKLGMHRCIPNLVEGSWNYFFTKSNPGNKV